jgi:hypothetical protein
MPQSVRAIITFVGDGGQPVDPSYGVPGFGGHPDNSLPSYGHPDNSLPGGGHIITLPVYPFDPTLGPDNTLPTPPVTVWPPRPGGKFVVKWLACHGLVLVPDNELPQTPEPK